MKARLLFALALACAPAFAAGPVAAPNRFAASVVPAERFDVDYMRTIGTVDMAKANELAKLEVVAVDGARHFVMFDQPRQVSDAIGRFLKSL